MNNTVKKIIETNRKIGLAQEDKINKEKNIDTKLELLSELSKHYWSNFSGIYSSYFIEKNLIDISNKRIKKIKAHKPSNQTLHVMTQAYTYGGHTRVVENWIKNLNNTTHNVFFTENKSTIPNDLQELTTKSGGKITLSKQNNYIDKAVELMEIASKHDKIILHIHMYDIVPILAFGNKIWNQPVHFYDHADHLFWLGVSVSDIVLNCYKLSKQRSLQKRGVRNVEILRLPIPSLKKTNSKLKRSDLNIKSSSKVIITMAKEYKYKPVQEYDFLKLINNISKKISNKLTLIVVGTKGTKSYWNQKLNFDIVPINITPDFKDYFKISDLYIDSLPLSSPTCFFEAINNGLDAITFKTPIFSLLESGHSIQEGTNKAIEILENKYHNNSKLKKKMKEFLPFEWKKSINRIYKKHKNLQHKTTQFQGSYLAGKDELFITEISS